MTTYLVTGLGNSGYEYTTTRHNIGFMVVDHVAHQHHIKTKPNRFAHTAKIRYKNCDIHLIKPIEGMNLSGKAIVYWLNKWSIPKSNLLVIVDDIALPFGCIRLREKGSHGGHNGLAHIQNMTSGQGYARLRIGVGNNFTKGKQIEYVLSSFSLEEQKKIPDLIKQAEQIIYSFCFMGVQQAMNKHN